ncbi:MAG: PTS system mannose/fructose/sorbose family transporter subunit IID [Elusimicrobia bacterium]|nr:PTS system mannose/fructose/sorbose family transporter subunit IID [Elusimicrobiota bacterium]
MSAPKMSSWMMARVGARLLLLQARWDPARMQGLGLAFALDPWLAVCWSGEPEGLLSARRRHLGYFNTHPIAAWLVAGIVCRQEALAAALPSAAREAAIGRIHALKAGLGASLAGSYDSFFWGALRPASALAGILAAQAAYFLGSTRAPFWAAAAALLAYNAPAVAARLYGLSRGAVRGELAAAELAGLPVQSWILGLRRATVCAAALAFVLAAGPLGGGERLTAALTCAAGALLSWRGVSPLAQIGFVGLGGMAASAAGLRP